MHNRRTTETGKRFFNGVLVMTVYFSKLAKQEAKCMTIDHKGFNSPKAAQ